MSGRSTPVNSKDDIMASLDMNIPKDVLHEIIGTKAAKSGAEKVKESAPVKDETNVGTKANYELKSILQLAKEAKLDTNIAHKRKSFEPGKFSERLESSLSENKEEESDDSDGATDSKTKVKELPNHRVNQKLRIDYEGCATCSAVNGNKKSKDKNADDEDSDNAQKKDSFCWRCHKSDINMSCEICPRSYHIKCVKQSVPADLEHWLCPECVLVLKAENTTTRSAAMKEMTVEHLSNLLMFAVKRMIQCNGTDPFLGPVNESEFPDYRKYIVQPMDLTHLEHHLKNNVYGSTHAFEADAKWILHNSIIFNGYQSKLTTAAKSIVKICKQEMQEIENCHTCYLNANIKRKSWFVEVCPKPHILLWAKLKSFPYWPAKAMATNSQGMVDARFFGAHDRAWVPIKDCFLFSKRDPNSNNVQKHSINECIKELEVHVAKLKEVYGEFNYAPYKTPFEPEMETEQLKIFLPKYRPTADSQKNIGRSKTPTSLSTNTRDSSSGSVQKKRARSRSRGRKSVNEDKSMEGYGTDDEFDENGLDSERRSQFLKISYIDDKSKQLTDKNREITKSENQEAKGCESGGKLNEEKEKVKQNVQDNKEEDEEEKKLEPTPKRSRKNSEKHGEQNIRRLSNVSEKINKISIDENVEITLGTTSSSDSNISTVSVSDSSAKNVVQVDVENKELTISPQNKTKISDKIIRILNKSDENNEIVTSTPNKNKEVTQTDLLLKKYTQNVEKKEGEIEYIDVSKLEVPQKEVHNKNENSTVTTGNLLEDTQIDEANISSIIHLSSIDKTAAVATDSNSQQKRKKRSISSETNEAKQSNKTIKLTDQNETDPLASIEIKSEPYSDQETTEETPKPARSNTIDNVTKVINDVAAGFSAKTKERNNTPKQNKARKSFPAPTSKTDVQTTATVSNNNPAPPLIRIAPTSSSVQSISSKSTSHWSESQNFIPQTSNQLPPFIRISDIQQTNVVNVTTQAIPSSSFVIVTNSTPNQYLSNVMDEFRTLKDVLPEAAAKAVSELMCRPPPALKPRPPSAIAQGFEESAPSAAGPVTSKLNSVAYRMADYFRGMLTETLQDISTNFGDNAATVATLKAEIEQLKHKHSLEVLEIKKNVYSILKDIQKSIAEEQKKIVEEIRASCEAETIKRVQEAKSKQWCAQCFKEAQFYCCWNTSYCDYACQQKHWLKHMPKCTQNVSCLTPVPKPQVQPLVLRPAPPPKNISGKSLLAKPTKVVFNARGGNINNQIAQIMKTKSASHIRLVESTPGNYEIVGNPGSLKVGGKLITSTSMMGKLKSGNVITVNSASNTTVVTSSSENVSVVAETSTAKTKTYDLPTISNVMSLAD